MAWDAIDKIQRSVVELPQDFKPALAELQFNAVHFVGLASSIDLMQPMKGNVERTKEFSARQMNCKFSANYVRTFRLDGLGRFLEFGLLIDATVEDVAYPPLPNTCPRTGHRPSTRVSGDGRCPYGQLFMRRVHNT